LRQALHGTGVEVRRASPQVAHDYAEIFAGVPSQHDGKDAAVGACKMAPAVFGIYLNTLSFLGDAVIGCTAEGGA
jgi:hypothetical protein